MACVLAVKVVVICIQKDAKKPDETLDTCL